MSDPLLRRKLFAGSRWDSYAILLGGLAAVWHWLNWPRFPFFIDIYYHLAVTQGFGDARGWVGWAFWECAPAGRPHLYPPLFHLTQLILLRAGLPLLTIARLSDALVYPAALAVLWSVIRRLFPASLAFFVLFLAVSSHSFGLSLVNNPPFALGLLLGLLSWYFLEKGRKTSSRVCLIFSFYTHALAPWLLVLAILLYRVPRGIREFRQALAVCAGAVAVASPILFHQLRYLSYAGIAPLFEAREVIFSPLLYVLGVGGLWVSFRKRGRHLFFIALAVSFSGLLFLGSNRFFSGQGQIAAIFLAAACLDAVREALAAKGRRILVLFLGGLGFVFLAATPLVVFSPLRKEARVWLGSKLFDSLETGHRVFGARQETLFDRRRTQGLVRLVSGATAPDQIVFSNYNYVGGMVAALAHRATSMAMLPEVRPFVSSDGVNEAHLILWFKDPEGGFPAQLDALARRYRLNFMAENEIAYVLINANALARRRLIPARLPFGACVALIAAGVGLVAVDARKNKG